MKINLLKINTMKRFAKWLDTNNVHYTLWDKWMWNDKVFLGLDRRQRQANERDKFCRNRKRPGFKHLADNRLEQFSKSDKLLTYIVKRKARNEY